MDYTTTPAHVTYVGAAADLPPSDFKQYGTVLLPCTALRPVTSTLESANSQVLAQANKLRCRLETLGVVRLALTVLDFDDSSVRELGRALDVSGREQPGRSCFGVRVKPAAPART